MYSYYEYAVGYPSDNAGISVVHARTYDTLTLILNTEIVVISTKMLDGKSSQHLVVRASKREDAAGNKNRM